MKQAVLEKPALSHLLVNNMIALERRLAETSKKLHGDTSLASSKF